MVVAAWELPFVGGWNPVQRERKWPALVKSIERVEARRSAFASPEALTVLL